MAEAVGLAIGVVSLASLYQACVDCMECVSRGRNCGKDFELSMTRFILLKARLNAWGKSLQVDRPGNELPALREQWEQEQTTIGRALIGIKDIFLDCQSLEKKYGLQEQDPNDVGQELVEGTQTSISLESVERAFRSSTRSRQHELPLWKKSIWAIRDSKKFDTFISNLAFFIDNLEKLSDRLQVLSVQQMLLQTNINAVTIKSGIALLEEASKVPQTIKNPKQSAGSHVIPVTSNGKESELANRNGPTFQYGYSSLRPVAKYVSRPTLESKIRSQLHSPTLTDTSEGRTLVIWGLGGSGKSQLMLSHIRNHRQDYEAVFWVQAGQKATIERDFIRIHRMLFPQIISTAGDGSIALDDAIPAIKNWFNRQTGRSLLVVDSADSIDDPEDPSYIDLNYYSPDSPQVDMVITTRSSQAQAISSLEAVEVGELTETEAYKLFCSYVKTNTQDIRTEQEIVKIVEELGYLALAITLAGSHVAVTPRLRSNIMLYLPEYHKHRKRLLSRKAVPNIHSYNHSVISTWETSFEAVKQQSVGAASLLCLLAFLNFDDIFTNLISTVPDSDEVYEPEEAYHSTDQTEDSGNLYHCYEQSTNQDINFLGEISNKKDRAHSEEVSSYVKTTRNPFEEKSYQYGTTSFEPIIFERYDVESGFETLQKYSLLSLQEGEEAYTMHKLVHTWCYDRLEAEERQNCILVALQLLDQAVTVWRKSTTRTFKLRRFVPHIAANFISIATELKKSSIVKRVNLERIARLVCALHETGKWEHLLHMIEYITKYTEELFGAEDPLIVLLKPVLAETLNIKGKYKESEVVCRELLKVQERILPAEHSEILDTKNLLSSNLANLNERTEAKLLKFQVLEMTQKLFGPDDPRTIRCKGELAGILHIMHQNNLAEEFSLQALESAKKIKWESHEVQQFRMNLAMIWVTYKRYDEAEELLKSATIELEKLIGEDHPTTLSCKSILANLMFEKGRFEVAGDSFRELIGDRERQLGLEHPAVMDITIRYAITMHYRGQRQEAIELAKECLQLRTRVLGAQHESTILIANLVEFWLELGSYPIWPHEM